jgi:hypothetical protein
VKLTTQLHLVPRSTNEWSYTSTPQYTFMAWCLVKAQGQLYLYLYLHCVRHRMRCLIIFCVPLYSSCSLIYKPYLHSRQTSSVTEIHLLIATGTVHFPILRVNFILMFLASSTVCVEAAAIFCRVMSGRRPGTFTNRKGFYRYRSYLDIVTQWTDCEEISH